MQQQQESHKKQRATNNSEGLGRRAMGYISREQAASCAGDDALGVCTYYLLTTLGT